MLSTLIAELRQLRPWVYLSALTVAVLSIFLYFHQDWRLQQRLYADGAHTSGWVTSKDIVGGKKVDYAFRVGERLYRGTGVAGYGNPSFSQLMMDDTVLVFYLPKDPSVSALGDPKEHVEDQHRWMAWALVFFVPSLLMALRAELKGHG